MEGKGLLFEDGDIYDGAFVQNNKHGYGIIYMKNGDRYEGNWKNNTKNGKGIYYSHEGDKYDGEWDRILLI
jgi:hypothetical protein